MPHSKQTGTESEQTMRPPAQAGANRRQRAQAMRETAARAQRRRTMLTVVATFVVVLVLLAALVVGFESQTHDSDTSANRADVSGIGAEQPPPWPLPDNPTERAGQAGLSVGPMGTAEHHHAHLDIIIAGKPVDVPANLGVDPATGGMAALHTHTPDGLIHVEAASQGDTFTLGQLFTEWNVRLTADQIGSIQVGADGPQTVYVNGEPYDGNPATLKLQDEQEIALVYGNEIPSEIPDTYDFSQA